MAVLKLTKDNFEQATNSEKPVLVDFYADWCGPCRMVSPVIDEIASERDDVLVCKVNVDEEEALAQQFGVMSIPTLIVFKDGQVAAKTVGVQSKQNILKMLG